MDALRVTLSELLAGLADFALLDPAAALEPGPLVLEIDPLAPADLLRRAAARIRGAAAPVLGIVAGSPGPGSGPVAPALRELASRLDATFVQGGPLAIGRDGPLPMLISRPGDARRPPTRAPELIALENPRDGLELTVHALREHPQAATIFAQALRASAGLEVDEALDVESLAYSTLLGGAEFSDWLRSRGARPLPPPAAQEAVLIDRSAESLTLSLNRPERRNAYGVEVRDGLVAGLLTAATDPPARIVLRGNGPSFCAGGDLDEFGTTPDLSSAHLIRTRAGAARLLARVAERTEARIHGSCVGAGIEIPALARRVVADPASTLRLPEVSMGLIPGAGGTTSLPRRIGRWWTFVICATGLSVTAPAALSLGLIDEIDAVTG